MFVIGRHLADAFAAEQLAVMDDLDDARAFLDGCTATIAPVTLRLQFREAGWKARRHRFGDLDLHVLGRLRPRLQPVAWLVPTLVHERPLGAFVVHPQ